MTIYFTRCVHMKSIKMLSIYYHKLIVKTEQHERKQYLIVDDYITDKVLEETKEITGTKKFGYTKILIDTDDKLWGNITLKNVLLVMISVIKDGNKFSPQLRLEEALHDE